MRDREKRCPGGMLKKIDGNEDKRGRIPKNMMGMQKEGEGYRKNKAGDEWRQGEKKRDAKKKGDAKKRGGTTLKRSGYCTLG